jgi:predicted PurR-regulated permease PerM
MAHQTPQKIDISLSSVLTFFGVLIGLMLLFLIRDVVVVVFISLVLASALDPIVDWFERFWPRWAGVTAVFATILAVLILVGFLMIPPVINQTQGLIDNFASGNLNFSIPQLGIDVNSQNIIHDLHQNAHSLTSAIQPLLSTTQSVFTGATAVLGVIILTLYILLDEKIMKQSVVDLVPAQHRDQVILVGHRVADKMGAWLRGQIFLSIAVAVGALIGLWLFGVNYALTLALFAGITELLPIIGPFLGAGAAILVALADSVSTAVFIGLWFLALQQAEAHVLVPQIMRKTLGLSPVVIVVALLIGAKLMGILGLLLAVPAASAISVLVNEYSRDHNLGGNSSEEKKKA